MGNQAPSLWTCTRTSEYEDKTG